MSEQELKEKIEKIISYKTYSKKRKTDAMLEIDANMYTNLGLESSKEEREQVKKNSIYIFREMKKVDWELGSAMLLSMGKLK